MAFDVDKLFRECKAKIADFSGEHAAETFYAFAIDADMLCLNSNEQFARTLNEYRKRWELRTRHISTLAELTEDDMHFEKFRLNLAEKHFGLNRSDEAAVLQVINEERSRQRSEGCEYDSEKNVNELRSNTGDWAYQGFADLDDENGFDSGLYYDDHYYAAMDSEDGHAPDTAYAIAMTELVRRLRESDAFDCLQRTDDFVVTWVDHSY